MGTRSILLGLAALLISAEPVSAQYFGRNKVQYERFEFQVLRTAHFDVHYYPAERDAALHASAMAERWYARLSRALDHTLTERTPIILYASHPHFAQTTVLPGMVPEGVGGFTDHMKGRVVLPFAAGLGETDRVLGHELVHAFQRDILQRSGRSMTLLPLWFLEGMAEHLTLEGIDANTAMWIRDAVDANRLPAIRELHDPRWFPYRYGQAVWAFLADAFGDDIAARALASRANGGAIGRLVAVTGLKEAALTARWHAAVRADTPPPAPDRVAAAPPRAETLVSRRRGAGRLNLGPAFSPDGAHLVFLSERDRYSIDVYLADGTTGSIRRKIVATAGNPRFDSLQFIDSAGAWDAASERFALAALQDGDPVLTILGMPEGDVQHEQSFPELDQIFDPTWSPSGDRIAFSALRGGVSDLYVVDLSAGSLRRLTADDFADLQPAWSPDGRTIAFATDRFTSSLDALTFGRYRLGALDVDSGTIRELPSVVDAKNIDPQWSGGDLYFIADADGVSNVFRLDIAAGSVHQVTNERNGVSGITALSPALSVAPGAGRLAYSVYRRGGYEIRTMPLVAGAAAVASVSSPAPQPEAAAVSGRIGPQQPAPFAHARYRGGMSLNGFGQPYLSAGGGALGGFFRAGTSLSFSDLLEQRHLQVAFQIGTRVRDFAVETAYVNRRSRWSWGFAGGQLPATFVSARTTSEPGSDTIVRDTEWLRQTHRQGVALAAYPFSRVRRFELTTGVHAIAFGRDIRTRRYARSTGELVDERTEPAAAPASIMLAESAAALVYDSSIAGPTAPVLGRRSRFEVAPTFGDLAFVTVTADYRRYIMPVAPFTVAFRLQHVGRYGPDAADDRLLPLLWTLRDLVRGYTLRDASATERLFVANVELRAPLMGAMGLIRESTMVPLDVFLFADAGAFETRVDRRPARTTLRSVGAGARVNATGFVFELAGAFTLDRTARGWALAANFRPGF